MPFDFFGSLGRKKVPRHDRNGTLTLDLNGSLPPPFIPTQYAASHKPSNARSLKTSKSWYTPLPGRWGDTLGESQDLRPPLPTESRLKNEGRITTIRCYGDQRNLQDDTYDDGVYDMELDESYRFKRKMIENWRQNAHGNPNSPEPRHVGKPVRTPLKLKVPAPVADSKRSAESSGSYSKPQTTSAPRSLDKQQFQQGCSANRSVYSMTSSKARAKSTPHLLETTKDIPLLLPPAQIHRGWCTKCKAIPPNGTTCVHGVSSSSTRRKRD